MVDAVNRRGFLGALLGVPRAAKVTRPAPQLAGMDAWVPVDGDPFFGIDRSVDGRRMSDFYAPTPDLRAALIDAIEKMRTMPPVRPWAPIDWREIAG